MRGISHRQPEGCRLAISRPGREEVLFDLFNASSIDRPHNLSIHYESSVVDESPGKNFCNIRITI